MPQLVKIQCKIRRSAFSGERIVVFTLAGQEYRTTAPVHYCRTETGSELSEMEPKPGEAVTGSISLPVAHSEGRAHIAMPDGEFIEISDSVISSLKAG